MFADVSFSTEATVAISGLLIALASAIGVLFWQYQKAVDARISSLVNRVNSYEQISERALTVLTVQAEAKLATEGKTLPAALAPVVPEHRSPMTGEQRDVAKLATARARLTALELALGVPARE